MKFRKYLQEDITIPVEIGDIILGGRFKNKKVKVKNIDQDENGNVFVNGKPLMKYRLIKKEEDEEQKEE
jgi:hypothetical protein